MSNKYSKKFYNNFLHSKTSNLQLKIKINKNSKLSSNKQLQDRMTIINKKDNNRTRIKGKANSCFLSFTINVTLRISIKMVLHNYLSIYKELIKDRF